jgi:hypothetical protein
LAHFKGIEIMKIVARITSKDKILKLQNRETGESINKTIQKIPTCETGQLNNRNYLKCTIKCNSRSMLENIIREDEIIGA